MTTPTLIDACASHEARRCDHSPPCPAADAVDREAAHTVEYHPVQGWSLLCNGVVLFEDTGDLLPDGTAIAPHRGPCPHVKTTT